MVSAGGPPTTRASGPRTPRAGHRRNGRAGFEGLELRVSKLQENARCRPKKTRGQSRKAPKIRDRGDSSAAWHKQPFNPSFKPHESL